MSYTSCTVTFGIRDVTAQYDASYSSSNAKPFVNFKEFNLESGLVPPKVSTLEDGFFWQDGTFDLFPDNTEKVEYIYWSNSMSDGTGNFSDPPILEIQFTQNHSSVGLMLRFYEPTNDFPDQIEIRYYNSVGAQISEKQFDVDSVVFMATNPVSNYRRIEISFIHTNNPFRFIKMLSIGYGLEKTFGENEIVTASILEQLNPISAEIPINTLSLKVYSRDDEFNPLNPQGLFAYLQEKQPLDVTAIVNSDAIDMGTYYLDKWEGAEDNSLTISAIDILGVIDQTQFIGGMYSNYPAPQLISDIMNSANADYFLAYEYDDVTVSGHLPILPHRQALQQVAVAIGAVVDRARTDIINIVPPPARPSLHISKSRKFMGGTVKLKQLVTGVSVTSHSYIPGTERREVLNQNLYAGQYEINFSEPLRNVTITGGTIIEINVNRALISTTGGIVVLAGYNYIDSQKIVTKKMDLPSGASENILSVNAATLISESNAKDVAVRMFEYYQRRYQHNFRLITNREKVGDYVVADSLRGEKLRGSIESMNIDLTGGFLSDVEMNGVHIITFDGNYAGEFWTGETIGVI